MSYNKIYFRNSQDLRTYERSFCRFNEFDDEEEEEEKVRSLFIFRMLDHSEISLQTYNSLNYSVSITTKSTVQDVSFPNTFPLSLYLTSVPMTGR